jgi:hypothetical protein
MPESPRRSDSEHRDTVGALALKSGSFTCRSEQDPPRGHWQAAGDQPDARPDSPPESDLWPFAVQVTSVGAPGRERPDSGSRARAPDESRADLPLAARLSAPSRRSPRSRCGHGACSSPVPQVRALAVYGFEGHWQLRTSLRLRRARHGHVTEAYSSTAFGTSTGSACGSVIYSFSSPGHIGPVVRLDQRVVTVAFACHLRQTHRRWVGTCRVSRAAVAAMYTH